jgi:hypothetical protein
MRLSIEVQQRLVDLPLNPPPLPTRAGAGRNSPFPSDRGIAVVAGPFLIEALGSSHDRAHFSCVVEAMNL